MKNKLIALAISLSLFSASCNTYVPAIQVDAASRTMNLKVYFDITTTAQYGVPNEFLERFPRIASKVQGFYFGAFSINLKFTNLKKADVLNTAMYRCLAENDNDDYNRCCNLSYLLCNSKHHTNVYNVRNDFFNITNFDTSNCIAVYVSCGKFCEENLPGHNLYDGCTFPYDNLIEFRDNDYVYTGTGLGDIKNINYASEVLAHEIGHLYGLRDHYNTMYGDERDNCIWGYNNDEKKVRENLLVCSSCRTTIMSNANNYNHL